MSAQLHIRIESPHGKGTHGTNHIESWVDPRSCPASYWRKKRETRLRSTCILDFRQTDRQTGACCRNGRAHSYSSQILIINFLGRRSHLGTNIHQPPRVSTPSTATLLAQLECFNCHYSRGEWRHTSQRASSNPLALLSNPPLKHSPFLPKRVKLIAALSNYD